MEIIENKPNVSKTKATKVEVKIKKNNKFLTIISWFIFGIVIGVLGLFLWNYYAIKTSDSLFIQAEQAKVTEIVNKVGKLFFLPTGEVPEVDTITNINLLLVDQPFYKNAMNGDVVLVYKKAAKAVIYSPSRNLIINTGPVYTQADTQVTTSTKSTATSTKK